MAPQLEPPPLPNAATARRRSVFVKIVCIVAVLLLLHVPLILMRGVLRERQRFQAQATAEISGVWGREQRVTGPILAVPYTYRGTITRNKVVNNQSVQVDEPAQFSATAYFLPEELNVTATVEPEIRRRGIYDVVVYNSKLKVAGSVRADFNGAGIEADRIDWAKARVLIGVTDLHGLRSITPLRRADGTEAPFEAAEAGSTPYLPLAANPRIAAPTDAVAFSLEAALQGSGGITVSPVGKITTAAIRSKWPSPSFVGAWLPVERQVGVEGFDAQWTVAQFSRGFPQAWTSRFTAEADVAHKIESAAFGVRLVRGIDGYSVVERAQKYGVLFFVLVFAVFFLFEITAQLRIHPLQYGMVGAALCLFFLGFLALTEFWTTDVAYGTVAGLCTLMVSLYSWTFLRSGARTLIVFGGLGATYGYLYFVLKSEDYALIAGTAALFAMLALVMFFTRRINWYALDAPISAKA